MVAVVSFKDLRVPVDRHDFWWPKYGPTDHFPESFRNQMNLQKGGGNSR